MGVLDGKVAVVTGAGRGIGRAEALELARNGARVVVNDLGVTLDGREGDSTVAKAVVEEIAAAGGEAIAHLGDVGSWEGAGSLVGAAIAEWGRLDIVVNTAGVLRDKMIFNMGESDWDEVIRVHLRHTAAMTHHAAGYWRAKAKEDGPVRGRIINTTSGAGLLGNPSQSNYGAAKAAIAGFTVITAQELYRYGVTVNAISPVARTRMTEHVGVTGDLESGFDALDPANVAPLVAYLASDDAQWLTGQVIRIEGGKVGIYTGWQVVSEVDRGQQVSVDELPVLLRRLYGAYPKGVSTGGLLPPR